MGAVCAPPVCSGRVQPNSSVSWPATRILLVKTSTASFATIGVGKCQFSQKIWANCKDSTGRRIGLGKHYGSGNPEVRSTHSGSWAVRQTAYRWISRRHSPVETRGPVQTPMRFSNDSNCLLQKHHRARCVREVVVIQNSLDSPAIRGVERGATRGIRRSAQDVNFSSHEKGSRFLPRSVTDAVSMLPSNCGSTLVGSGAAKNSLDATRAVSDWVPVLCVNRRMCRDQAARAAPLPRDSPARSVAPRSAPLPAARVGPRFTLGSHSHRRQSKRRRLPRQLAHRTRTTLQRARAEF